MINLVFTVSVSVPKTLPLFLLHWQRSKQGRRLRDARVARVVEWKVAGLALASLAAATEDSVKRRLGALYDKLFED